MDAGASPEDGTPPEDGAIDSDVQEGSGGPVPVSVTDEEVLDALLAQELITREAIRSAVATAEAAAEAKAAEAAAAALAESSDEVGDAS